MKGIILAAGCGTRLSLRVGVHHKALLPVAGRAIIDYTLEAFSQTGVTDVAIVIGHQGDALREWVGDGSGRGLRIRYLFNPAYRRGNALSVYTAKSFAEDEPFLLSMADHMISSDLLGELLDLEGSVSALAVDYTLSPREAAEGTRVLVNREGMITRIGKSIPRWSCIDAGVFRLTPAIFDAIGDFMSVKGHKHELSQAISRMIEQGHPLQACDISGSFWHDIDTWDDLHLVRRTLEGEGLWSYSVRG